MSTTRQDAQKLLEERRSRELRAQRANRTVEFALLVVASLIVGWGFWLVYQAKSANFGAAAKLVNLNALQDSTQLLPVLDEITDGAARQAAAGRILDFSHRGNIPNVGAIA